MPGAIVNYHPGLKADHNLLLASQRPLDRRDYLAVAKAAAVLLPQICRPDLYALVAALNKPHFPRPLVHLGLDGKVGHHLLFKHHGLPQPRTLAFADLEQAARAWQKGRVAAAGIHAPLVAKGAGGGQGRNVFLVHTPEELLGLAGQLDTHCFQGPSGLVLQNRVAIPGRDARVVMVGRQVDCFWRLVPQEGAFFTSLSQGGIIDREGWPDEMARAVALVRRLQDLAGLDLAGVDVLVPLDAPPLLLEINFYFGRNAHGGTAGLRRMHLQAAREWLAGLGLDGESVGLDEED
ncbi:ATP-grasp domain-containing protein [Desulfarculales bacterium]